MKALLLLAACVPLSAQWIHYPTPGIPRTPDGKPNLSAPAPKTPDGRIVNLGITGRNASVENVGLRAPLLERREV